MTSTIKTKKAKAAANASSKDQATVKRYRPLGLSIALLSTAILYGLWPIAPVVFVWWVDSQRGTMGMDFVGNIALINAGMGVITLIASVIAWIGRPTWSRWTLILLVWISTFFHLLGVIQSSASGAAAAGGAQVGGNLDALSTPFQYCQMALLIAVALYVLWYMNRAPARQFYR